jgi:hypothetical protein
MEKTWKPFKVSYTYHGKHVVEDAMLTMDFEGNQIVVLPTCKGIIASVPKEICNLPKLRESAIEFVRSAMTMRSKRIENPD